MKTHLEEAFEAMIEQHLLSSGYVYRAASAYSADQALIRADLISYVQKTQAKKWAKVSAILGAKTEDTFIAAFDKACDINGVLYVLRHGFKFYGRTIRVATFRPTNNLNPQVRHDYSLNVLAVVRQVHHNPAHPTRSVDLVLFLNGIPVVTIELKNAITGQHAEHAVKQYKLRDPQAPLFRFKRRALVHFAVGTDAARYTTRLRGEDTFFLPFDRGQTLDGGYVRGQTSQAGNPPLKDKHPTCYLWEEVWQPDNLLELFGRFLHIQLKDKTDDKGQTHQNEVMIFPRYHQWDCVKLLADRVLTDPRGTNYLVQHSTGSGKSNSIAWLAHRLAFLHDGQDQRVFDCVVVITDRKVLDQQLQSTIYQIDHKQGVVQPVDEHSKQLAKALVAGVPIIITTIHKFGFIVDHVGTLPDRRYAIIVDEAHSSQSGEMAKGMKELLGASSIAATLDEEMEDADDDAAPEQGVLRAAISRGPQQNLSFFAFTATPKFKTLKLFGHVGADGKPAAIHLYSMRQAIEEKFVLDVLRNYITYKRYYSLVKAVEEDPLLDKKKASQALARFADLHETNFAQHTEVIVEHFRTAVMHRLGGRAKAMVVTGSRLEAVRFKREFERYIEEKGYTGLGVLVAFSGKVKDDEVPASLVKPFTEPEMNRHPITGVPLKESELPRAFASSSYNILIVASKYQTGFDQPLLCAMYVIRRLAGIQAVQTLSRLNRIYPGKTETFVLDFKNDREEILASFQAFYEGTTIAEDVSPQRLYELQAELDKPQVYWETEVDTFASVFFKPQAQQSPTDNARLNAAMKPARDRFTSWLDEAEEDAEEWRGKLSAFCNLYGFMSQIVPFSDVDLEKRFVFGRRLLVALPRAGGEPPPEIEKDVALDAYRLQLEASGNLGLSTQGRGTVGGPVDTGTGKPKAEKSPLSELIQSINDRFGTDFDAEDLLSATVKDLLDDDGLCQAAAVNDRDNFERVGGPAVEDALLSRHDKHTDFINQVFANPDILKLLQRAMLDEVYKQVNAA